MLVSSYITPKARKGEPSAIEGRCRGTVTGRDWQRPELQRRYRPYFSWYLQRRQAAGPAR